MSTPVINAIDNVNQSTLETVFESVAADPTARDNLSQSNRNIDKVSTNSGVIRTLDANEDAILRLLCRREGRDPSNFNTLDDVADDVSLVRDLSVRQTITEIIQFSAKASSALSANDRATREMMCFPAGLDATTFTDVADVASDGVAMSTISENTQAMRSAVVLPLSMQEVATSQTAMQEIAASQTAMQEVAASQTAVDEIVASQTAMQEVAASQTALDEIVASQTAMQGVAASSTAVSAIESASSVGTNSVPNTTDAPIYVAKLSGGGGGAGDPFGSDQGFGSSGGATTFHQSVAEGGGGGARGGSDGSDGGGNVSSPDLLINKSVGGGGAGGGGSGSGGDGGFVKALIINPNRQPLTLTVGSGGAAGGDDVDGGEDGSATIFTPNVF